MNRFVFIMPYFGRLPAYFPLFLKSLKGQHFDVLFVSDIAVEVAPNNFKRIEMSFDAFRRLASKKLGVSVGLEDPKKLCDFKPMYGKILEDYISSYAYWMVGDCDLVFGRQFCDYLDKIDAEQWDVVSMRKPWLSGPCAVFKNNECVRTLFQRTSNWREVATESGSNNLWDECGGCWHDKLEKGVWTMSDCSARRDSFGAAVFRSYDIRFLHEDDITECGLAGHCVTMSSDGVLTLDDEEIRCFHYIAIKTRRYFTCPKIYLEKVHSYCIDDAGFYLTPTACALRGVVRNWRKGIAFCQSLADNGIRHWFRRVFDQ